MTCAGTRWLTAPTTTSAPTAGACAVASRSHTPCWPGLGSFLDEPTTGLDPAIRDVIWQLIERLRRDEGVTIVLSTHYLEEAEGVCDRVAIVDHGLVVAEGRPSDLVDQLGPELIELRVGADAGRAAGALRASGPGSRPPLLRGDLVAMPVRASAEDLRASVGALTSDGPGIRASTIRRSTLADVFAHLTGATHPDPEDVSA